MGIGEISQRTLALEPTQAQATKSANAPSGLTQLPGGNPEAVLSSAEALQRTQALEVSADAQDIEAAQVRALIPAGVSRQIANLARAENLTPQSAQAGLSRLYAAHQDVSVHRALDQAAPAILGKSLVPAQSVEALLKEFRLAGEAREVLGGLLAEQIEHLVNASSTDDIRQALAELRGTEEILQTSGLLDESGQNLFADIRAAGDNKQQRIEALQANASAEVARQKTGEVSEKMAAIPEARGSVLARSLGMSVLRRAEKTQETALNHAQAQLAGTQKRLDRIASSKTSNTTLQGIVIHLEAGDTASLEKCRQFSAEKKASLEKEITALEAKPGAPTEFQRSLKTLKNQVERLLSKEDAAAIQTQIERTEQQAHEGFKVAMIERRGAQAGAVLTALLTPAGFNERLETSLTEKLTTPEIETLAKALSPEASSADQAAGRDILDRALADDPVASDVLLAIKLDALTPNEETAAVTRAHAKTAAFAEVAALITRADPSHPMQAQEVTAEKLDEWLFALAEGTGKNTLGGADLLLINARFAAYVESHPEAAGKNPATIADFRALLPAFYRENAYLENILGKGLVASAQAKNVMASVETKAFDSSRMRSVLAASDPEADARRALSASNTCARLLTGLNLTDLDTPGQNPAEVRKMRTELVKTFVARKHSELTQQEVSSKTTATAASVNELAQASPMERALRKARGLDTKAAIKGETLAVTLHATQRLLAKDLSDLNVGQLQRLGLDAHNCKDIDTLQNLIASTDWRNQPLDYEHGMLLSTFLQAQQGLDMATPEGKAALKGLMNRLGIPDDRQGIVELLTQNEAARREHLSKLALFQESFFKEKQIQMDKMLSSAMGKSDADGEALKKAVKGYIDSKDDEFRKTILSLLKKEVPTVGDRLEVADLILAKKEHATRFNTKAIENAKDKAKIVKGSAVDQAIVRDKTGLLNQGSKVAVAEHQAQKDLADELIAFSSGATVSVSAKQAMSVGMLTQMAALGAFETWAERQTGDKSLKAFEAACQNELRAQGGAVTETALFKNISASLQKFGLTGSAADAFALSYIFVGDRAGDKNGGGLTHLMEGAMKLANGLDFVHRHLSIRREVPEAIVRMEEVGRQEAAARSILADMKQGAALELSDQMSVTLKGRIPVNGVTIAVALSAGAEDKLKIFRDENGRASLLIGKQYEAGIGASASVCNELIEVGVQIEGQVGKGVALTFASDEACAQFVARLVNGQASRADLVSCVSIETLWDAGAGVGVGIEVDVGKAIGASVVNLSAEASVGAKFSHETSVGLQGKTVTSTTTLSMKLGAEAGIDKDVVKEKLGVEKEKNRGIMESLQEILKEASTGVNGEVDKKGLTASASVELTETVENKVLTDHAGRHVKQASASCSTKAASAAVVSNYLAAHGVDQSVRNDITHYMESHDLEDVLVSCEYALPADELQGRAFNEAMVAVNDASRYRMEKITLSFAKGDMQQSGISTGVFSLQANALGQKTVEFRI